jgi:hypothetical protein
MSLCEMMQHYLLFKRRFKEQQDFVWPECLSIKSALMITPSDIKGQTYKQPDPLLSGGGGDGLKEEAVREDRLCGSGGSGSQEAC